MSQSQRDFHLGLVAVSNFPRRGARFESGPYWRSMSRTLCLTQVLLPFASALSYIDASLIAHATSDPPPR